MNTKEIKCKCPCHRIVPDEMNNCDCMKNHLTSQPTYEEEIRKICTYSSDDGTSGYELSEEQFGRIFDLIEKVLSSQRDYYIKELGLKRCSSCNKYKLLTDFWKNHAQPDGRDFHCKECNKISHTKRYYKNPELYASRMKKYRKTESAREKTHARNKKYRALYPDKYKARTILSNAIKYGKIKKLPCEICGNEKSEAHHPDYSKPLKVKWLCIKHHKENHRKYKNLSLLTKK